MNVCRIKKMFQFLNKAKKKTLSLASLKVENNIDIDSFAFERASRLGNLSAN